MDTRTMIVPGILALLVSVIALGRASMDEQTSSTSHDTQKVTRPREEFENLAIKKVRGEMPEILRGVWLQFPIYRVEVTVDPQGNVTDVYPLYGNSLLAEAALAAATKWKFPPQRVNGKPAQVVSAVNVEFQNLDEQRRQGLLEIAKQELQRHPELAANYYNVGFAHQIRQQYKEAAEYFQKTIEKAPDSPVAHAALGDAYYGLNQYEKALDCFRRATALKRDYFEPYQKIGWCYTKLEREDDAVNVLLQAAEQAKSADDRVGVYWNLVSRYESLGKKEEAAEAQMQVAKYAARYSLVTKRSAIDASGEAFSAAVKYERVGEKQKALAAYRLAMEIDPLSEPGLLARIMVAGYLRRNNRPDQATALLEAMVRMTDEAIRDYASRKNEEGLGNAYYWRGSAKRDLGEFAAAVEDLRKAIKYKPGWGKAHLELAYAYLGMGDLKSARKEYEAAGIVDAVFVRKLKRQAK